MSARPLAQCFIRMAGSWFAVTVVFRMIGGFGMGSGLVLTCTRLCPVVSYLLLAAGPRSSRFTGVALSRRTFFTTDLSFVVASGASGCLAGSEGALSEC